MNYEGELDEANKACGQGTGEYVQEVFKGNWLHNKLHGLSMNPFSLTMTL